MFLINEYVSLSLARAQRRRRAGSHAQTWNARRSDRDWELRPNDDSYFFWHQWTRDNRVVSNMVAVGILGGMQF